MANKKLIFIGLCLSILLLQIKASPIASSNQDNDNAEQMKQASVPEDAPWYKFCMDNIKYYENKAHENNVRRKRETYDENGELINEDWDEVSDSDEDDKSNEDTTDQSVESEQTTESNANEDLSKDQAPWRKFCMENLKHYNLGDTFEKQTWEFSDNTSV